MTGGCLFSSSPLWRSKQGWIYLLTEPENVIWMQILGAAFIRVTVPGEGLGWAEGKCSQAMGRGGNSCQDLCEMSSIIQTPSGQPPPSQSSHSPVWAPWLSGESGLHLCITILFPPSAAEVRGDPVSHQPSRICVTSSLSISVRKRRERIKGTVSLEQILAELEGRGGNASKFCWNEMEFAKKLEKVKYWCCGHTWEPRWALRPQCGRCFPHREQMLQVSWHWWLLHLPWCLNENCKV